MKTLATKKEKKSKFVFYKNIYFWINLFFLVSTLVLLQHLFPYAWIVFWYSLITIANGCVVYFNKITDFTYSDTGTLFYELIQDKNIISIDLPFNSSVDFGNWLQGIFEQYGNSSNLNSALSIVLLSFNLIYLLVALIAAVMIIKSTISADTLFRDKNPKKTGYTRSATKFKKFEQKIIHPVRDHIRFFLITFYEYKFNAFYILAFLIYFNIASAFLVIVGYILVVCCTYNIQTLFKGCYSLIYLFYDYFLKLPLPLILIGLFCVYNSYTKAKAKRYLAKLQFENEELVDTFGRSVFVDGPSGIGKTTIVTEMAFCSESRSRTKIRKKMDKFMNFFPSFPFQLLNKYLDEIIKNEKKMNRFIIRERIKKEFTSFYKKIYEESKTPGYKFNIQPSNLFYAYDIINGKTVHYTGNETIKLRDCLARYAECYYLYQRNALGIVSNYPVATTLNRYTEDYLISWKNTWNDDLRFYWETDYKQKLDEKLKKEKIKSKKRKETKELKKTLNEVVTFEMGEEKRHQKTHELKFDYKYAGVLNFDSMRMGVKKDYTNKAPFIDCLTIIVDEVDKERGNQFATRGMKVTAEEANLVNDKFGWYQNTVRHSALVDNEPHTRMFFTCQRQNDLALGIVQCCECCIDIKPDKQYKNSYYKYSILRRLFAKFIINLTERSKYKYLQTRNYISFPFLLLSAANASANNYIQYIDNRFGYQVVKLRVRDPRSIENTKDKCMFIINRRSYSNNFKSDSLEFIFKDDALNAINNFENELKYKSLEMTSEEYKYQNSHSEDFMFNKNKSNNKNKKKEN